MTPEILSDEALKEIEAREPIPRNGEMLLVLKASERDALCATVRALRADLKAEHSLRVMQNAMRESAEKECADLRAELKGKQQVIDELIVAAKRWEDEAFRLKTEKE